MTQIYGVGGSYPVVGFSVSPPPHLSHHQHTTPSGGRRYGVELPHGQGTIDNIADFNFDNTNIKTTNS